MWMRIRLFTLLLLCIALVSCRSEEKGAQQITAQSGEKTSETSSSPEGQTELSILKQPLLMSNMADQESMDLVRNILRKALDEGSVDAFMQLVEEYNHTVESHGLFGAFEKKVQPEYDLAALAELWTNKYVDYIGTNCRLNAFTLLKADIEVESGDFDDSLLFMDQSAIESGELMNEAERQRFVQLFSRVQTEATKNPRVHAKHMQEHFKHIRFDEDARMISLVIHDNLDGDALFIGHVGVAVEHEGAYLFVEKLSFELPYQAIWFASKEDIYRYLYEKYQHYSDDTTSKPFVMDNDEFVD